MRVPAPASGARSGRRRRDRVGYAASTPARPRRHRSRARPSARPRRLRRRAPAPRLVAGSLRRPVWTRTTLSDAFPPAGADWRSPGRRAPRAGNRACRCPRRDGRSGWAGPAEPAGPRLAAHLRPGASRTSRSSPPAPRGSWRCSGATRCSPSYMALPLDPDARARDAADARASCRARDRPRTEEQPGRILHEVRLGRRARTSPSAAARSTTAPSTRRRCSSCCSASWRAGAGSHGESTNSSPPPTAPWSGSPTRRRPRRRRIRRIRAGSTTTAWSTRAGRTPGTASPSPTAPRPRADRAVRGAGLRLRRLPRPCRARSRAAATTTRPRSWDRPGGRPEGRVQRGVLAARQRLLRARPRPRQAPVDSCASNMGHCLWSGIVDDDKAAAVAERLLSPTRCSPAGACARWPPTWAPTTR